MFSCLPPQSITYFTHMHNDTQNCSTQPVYEYFLSRRDGEGFYLIMMTMMTNMMIVMMMMMMMIIIIMTTIIYFVALSSRNFSSRLMWQ